MHTHRCDSCGAILDAETASAVLVGVALAISEPRTVHDVLGQRHQLPAKEEFELCPECAMALLINLKLRKLELQKSGKVLAQ